MLNEHQYQSWLINCKIFNFKLMVDLGNLNKLWWRILARGKTNGSSLHDSWNYCTVIQIIVQRRICDIFYIIWMFKVFFTNTKTTTSCCDRIEQYHQCCLKHSLIYFEKLWDPSVHCIMYIVWQPLECLDIVCFTFLTVNPFL